MFRPDAFFPVLRRAADLLEQHEIRYYLTGGLVSIFYGEPRLTQDADLVVDPVRLKECLEPFIEDVLRFGYVANAATIRDAVSRGRQFQIIDAEECLKIDLYPRELVEGSLDRAIWVDLTEGLLFPIASRADVIASKLFWISKGSHKSRRDVRQLMQGITEEETAQAREFAERLKLTNLLDEVLAEPDEIE
jgi:hypothetical protein